MANYYASARSNYFRVKDIEAFKADCPVEIEVETHGNGKDYCYILFEEGIEEWVYPKDNDPQEIDWAALFANHLEEDSVAIFMEAGACKLRYICGYAYAYNSKGEKLRITLDDIYHLVAREWSPDLEVTNAEY
jgi:hypothetical protein